MKQDREFAKTWKEIARTESLQLELMGTIPDDLYGRRKRKRIEGELARLKSALFPPAARGVAVWHRAVAQAAWAAFRANEAISFKELLDVATKVRGVPEEETVRRFLNHIGFHGRPGRPNKH